MALGKQVLRILTNRYLLATAGFVCWMLFFDRNDFFTRQQRTRELRELEGRITFYDQEISRLRQELHNLQNDPATLEQHAREQYFMKRPNEDIFVFDSSLHQGTRGAQ